MKRAVIALALLLANPARGEMSLDGELYYLNPSYTIGQFSIINDNNGATYDSYRLLSNDLALQLWQTNPRLPGIYSNVAQMLAAGLSYTISPIGEINVGWSSIIETNGDVRLWHIDGDPNGVDYLQWESTQQNPNRDQQIGVFMISKTLLDLDGDGWSAGEDLVIENDTNQVVLLGVAQEGVNSYYDHAPRPVVRVGGERGKVAGFALDGLAATSLVAGAEVSVEEWRMECWSNGVVECWSTNSTFTATGKVQQVAVPMTNDSGWFRLKMTW